MFSDRSIARLIDHTLLKAEAVRVEIEQLCAEAREYAFACACVNSFWVPLVAAHLDGTHTATCTVVGFPLGANSTEAKVAETRIALAAGASEIDMVLNIGALRAGEFKVVEDDIRAVTEAAHGAGAIVKVILETALLDNEHKVLACRLAVDAQADFVKTSTGFSKSGATLEDVSLMRHTVGPHFGVKASGGIRSLEDLHAMVAAGATRIGTSAGVKIMQAAGGQGA
jgi:deoxyribose-phosphate aldolase